MTINTEVQQGGELPQDEPPYAFVKYSLGYIEKWKSELSTAVVESLIKRGWGGYEGDIWRAAALAQRAASVPDAGLIRDAERYRKARIVAYRLAVGNPTPEEFDAAVDSIAAPQTTEKP